MFQRPRQRRRSPATGDETRPPHVRPEDHDDETTRLALLARDGDPIAVGAFIRVTQRDVWRLCAGLVDAATADDLTQETYLRAWRSLPNFAGASTVRTWLLGIARRVCADHIRSIVRDRRVADRAADAARDEREPDHAARLAVSDLLNDLTPERRAAFVLTQVVGLSYAEVAVMENIPVGTVRSRVARARGDLLLAWRQAADV